MLTRHIAYFGAISPFVQAHHSPRKLTEFMKNESNAVNVTHDPALPQVLLIQTGTPPDAIRHEHGDLPAWFIKATDLAPEAIQVVQVFKGEALPEPDPTRVAIITGSWDMVTDKLAWSEATAAWIRRAVEAGMPLFGVCYGHQLIAHALGGVVDYHPQGCEMGCLEVRLATAGVNDPLIGTLPENFKAHLTHLQTVITPPPGAQTLASSAHDKNQIIRYSKNVISTQFHPEITPAIATSMINQRTEGLLKEGFDPARMLGALTDAADARGLLKQFIALHTQPLPTKQSEY